MITVSKQDKTLAKNKGRKKERPTAEGDTPRRGKRRSIRYQAYEEYPEDREQEPDPDKPPDLHLRMMRAEDALIRLEAQLLSWQGRGIREALVVHGKGQNSPGHVSVLGPAVRDWCDRHGELVISWKEAPAKWGGSGAIVVFLS